MPRTKPLNQTGDYYYCSVCSTWHRLQPDADSIGQQHLIYFDEAATNAPTASYYFCRHCMKWHSSYKAHLTHRAHIKSDGKVELPKQPTDAQKERTQKEPIIGGFDGADGLWKSFYEHLNSIRIASLRQRCMEILEISRSLEEQKVQCFSRKAGFSFIIRGLKVGQMHVNRTDFHLTLIKKIHNTGSRSVRQEESKYTFSSADQNPISKSDIRTHLLEQSNTLLTLRHKNAIGYMEKWLHSLLIEQMGGLSEFELDFLYYEAPVGKVKRNKQYGREHVDIVARERGSNALIIVEVKKDNKDLRSAMEQGTSYIEWIHEHKRHLAPRIEELGWDVDLECLKLYIVAPGAELNVNELRQIATKTSDNFEVKMVLINRNWYKDERLHVVDSIVI